MIFSFVQQLLFLEHDVVLIVLTASNYKYVHCARSNLNLHVKTEPITAGADATVYVQLLFTYTVASASTVIDSVFMLRFRFYV